MIDQSDEASNQSLNASVASSSVVAASTSSVTSNQSNNLIKRKRKINFENDPVRKHFKANPDGCFECTLMIDDKKCNSEMGPKTSNSSFKYHLTNVHKMTIPCSKKKKNQVRVPMKLYSNG